jgi:hypothetical protein
MCNNRVGFFLTTPKKKIHSGKKRREKKIVDYFLCLFLSESKYLYENDILTQSSFLCPFIRHFWPIKDSSRTLLRGNKMSLRFFFYVWINILPRGINDRNDIINYSFLFSFHRKLYLMEASLFFSLLAIYKPSLKGYTNCKLCRLSFMW